MSHSTCGSVEKKFFRGSALNTCATPLLFVAKLSPEEKIGVVELDSKKSTVETPVSSLVSACSTWIIPIATDAPSFGDFMEMVGGVTSTPDPVMKDCAHKKFAFPTKHFSPSPFAAFRIVESRTHSYSVSARKQCAVGFGSGQVAVGVNVTMVPLVTNVPATGSPPFCLIVIPSLTVVESSGCEKINCGSRLRKPMEHCAVFVEERWNLL